MQRSTQIILQSVIIGSLLIGITVGGTIAAENLPSSWKSNLFQPPSATAQFNGTLLANAYNSILSLMNQNQFANASLELTALSFVNYPNNLQGPASLVVSEISILNSSVPRSGSLLVNTIAQISTGLIQNATTSIDEGCIQANNANTALNQLSNSTAPQLNNLGVPSSVYASSLNTLGFTVSSLVRQCKVLLGELKSSFQSNSTEVCVKLLDTSYCLSLASPQKSIEVGGTLELHGSFLMNSTGIGGDQISFYLNGTFIGNTRTISDGSYSVNMSLPYIYAFNATIWAIASANSSIGAPIAIGSNAIYIHLLFNATKIIVSAAHFNSRVVSFYPGIDNLPQLLSRHEMR
jgi:hypothetical protein